MNRVLTIVALACLLVPAAAAAKKSSPAPSISLVTPMRVKVGKTLTVRGAHFATPAKANKVILETGGGRKVIVVPSKASSTRLVFTVPRSAERILTARGGVGQPTRAYLRVITKAYGKRSKLTHSPVIVSARASSESPSGTTGTPSRPVTATPLASPQGGPAPAAVPASCGTGSDWDSDLLDNATELQFGLNPCLADSDGDSMGDGWEFWSARDLNVRAVPYPGKKPYPNPLDGGDGGYDFDGDSLTASTEYRAWVYSGREYSQANPASPLGYSDGTQTSRPTVVPPTPAFRSASLGQAYTPPSYPAAYDYDSSGTYSDDERDADADGLTNFIEASGPGHASWWTSVLSGASVQPWPGSDPYQSYSYFGAFTERPFADTDLVDPDVDGDTLLDGEDDQDNDDVPNTREMYDPIGTTAVNGQQFRKNAFNPCAPNIRSRTCPRYYPVR